MAVIPYTVTNQTGMGRSFHDVFGRVRISHSGSVLHGVMLDDEVVSKMSERNNGLVFTPTINGNTVSKPILQPIERVVQQRRQFSITQDIPPERAAQTNYGKPPLIVTGHFGIGDNIHQRAVMRELMKERTVWLNTCHYQLYHDLVEQGLHLILRPTGLHAQAKTIARERRLFDRGFVNPPSTAPRKVIGYPKAAIDKYGSILEAMFGAVNLQYPDKPDFSLPIAPSWRTQARQLISSWPIGDKKLMVYRPIVIRREWNGASRNPDPQTYAALFEEARKGFFVVSVADLSPGREDIVGTEAQVDVKLHEGQLDFPTMAALWADADVVFCNAGFAPVLAQAVGTPSITVYGGRESYRTTQRAGAHLAATLGIDPDQPCDCHSATHACKKHITLPPALEKVRGFIDGEVIAKPRLRTPRVLIYGTFWEDNPTRAHQTDLWVRLHKYLNPDCELMLIDSQSPHRPTALERHPSIRHFNFPDNIGHLSRRGRDGWGRAFCKGLEIAIEEQYDYAVHIEGDSLLRLPVMPIVKEMARNGEKVLSTPVTGMRVPGSEAGWLETGLMFFSTKFVSESKFIEKYDWPNRKVTPTPEVVCRSILRPDLTMMPWKAWRCDKNQFNNTNVVSFNLDWITHAHNDVLAYDRFAEEVMKNTTVVTQVRTDNVATDIKVPSLPKAVPAAVALKKLNLGCGTNKLVGWENHDADVDITQKLPWPNGSASHIFIEHCVEHIPYKKAIEFFKECRRVLAPGGVLRIAVPSLEQIRKCDESDYHRFTTKWQSLGANVRGAMHAIIYAHGHETCWTASLLEATLFFVGFDQLTQCEVGKSDHAELRGVEGHGKVIGPKFNSIESLVFEAVNPVTVAADRVKGVAIVIGGGDCWQDDLEAARSMINGGPVHYFVLNDHIEDFAEPATGVSLHPDKLPRWLSTRRQNQYPPLDDVWAHLRNASVTRTSNDWQGSVGLFGAKIAMTEYKYEKVILCGVPMTVEGNHYRRHHKWTAAHPFRQGWVNHKAELAPYVRSMSGWTAEQLGKPDADWLNN